MKIKELKIEEGMVAKFKNGSMGVFVEDDEGYLALCHKGQLIRFTKESRFDIMALYKPAEELSVKRDEIYQMLTGNGLEV